MPNCAPSPYLAPQPLSLPVWKSVVVGAKPLTLVRVYAVPNFTNTDELWPRPNGTPARKATSRPRALLSPPPRLNLPKSTNPTSSPTVLLNLPPKYAFHAVSRLSHENPAGQDASNLDRPMLNPA